jgi:hypothetical protein
LLHSPRHESCVSQTNSRVNKICHNQLFAPHRRLGDIGACASWKGQRDAVLYSVVKWMSRAILEDDATTGYLYLADPSQQILGMCWLSDVPEGPVAPGAPFVRSTGPSQPPQI